MECLFSPFRLKQLEIPNRIVMPALASFLIEPDGTITEKTVEHYRRRASGGPGMIIVEACAVSPEGVVSAHQARIYEDRFVEGLARIAEAIRAEGVVPAVQIHHGGRQTSAKVIGRKPLAPSPIPCPSIKGEVEPLTREGIQELVDQFATAAVRARRAGFELVEIHGAHGYLVNQFLSPYSNKREDEYGGDLAGRTRFACDIVREIRRRVGGEYPLSFKISAEEFVPGGLTVEDSIAILELLQQAGIDIVQVSAGNDATPEWICQPMFMDKACLVPFAAKIRSALRLPVMAVGRINDPHIAESILARGQADLVCMGRGLLADPDMPKKARAGDFDTIRFCIACNTCMESIFRRGRVECLVNPFLGREQELVIRPADKKRRILVVGGGPAGLSAAWIAARRGHEVTLCDRQPVLGGQLVAGSEPRFKRELKTLIRFLSRQVELSGVRRLLGFAVDAGFIAASRPDAVVIATGSNPVLPPVPGIERPFVYSYNQVLNGLGTRACRTVVIGGGATGCEIALHLAEAGSPVSLIEMEPRIGQGIEAISRKVILERLSRFKVEVFTRSRLIRIDEAGAVIGHAEQGERLLPAERVVIAVGCRPENGLADEVRQLGIEMHLLGDCVEPRNAKAAIYEGTVLGLSI
ncbi:MAG: FAD-dependent oxidoreductase [Desulfobacterales bacterium]